MLRFVEDDDLYVAVKHNNTNVRYRYYNDYYKSCRLIDHFFVTKILYGYIEKYYYLCEKVDTATDHCPIIIQ